VRSLRNLRLRERAAVARAVLQRRCCGVCGCGCGSEIGLQLRKRAAEVLLRSLRPGLLLRLRLRRGLQCGLECGVARSATAEALSGARAVDRGARERDRAQEGARYERERGSTSMEFAQTTPVKQLYGFLHVPSALLALLALWRALRDLRECPREKRTTPGALCLVLVT
jgi:hypothetical protein